MQDDSARQTETAWWDSTDALGSRGAADETDPPADDAGSVDAAGTESVWSALAAPVYVPGEKGARLSGNAQANVLNGSAGDDTIKGRGGDDLLTGGYGGDKLIGGKGDDEIVGGTSMRSVDDAREHADVIKGGAGNDTIDGGGGDDIIKAGGGDDYIFGGYGGNDVIKAGGGNDRIGGGFTGGFGQPVRDDDILQGNGGQDIFEARFWAWDNRPGNYDKPMLGPHEDTILDFRSGQDHLDIVIYRQGQDFTFRRGGFELFDSNEDGILDGRDRFVEVEGSGKKASLTLDAGEALKASGLVSEAELETGPHTLTLKKVSSLDADDFVSTKQYVGRFSPSEGGRNTGGDLDEWLVGNSGNDILNGRLGDDLMTGHGGNDIFEMSWAGNSGPGHDLIQDFERGADTLAIFGRGGETLSFDMVDSNGDGILDGRDAAVRVEEQQLLAPGETPTVGQTTIIDLDVAFGYAGAFTATNAVTLHGVTGLTASDFRDSTLDSNVA